MNRAPKDQNNLYDAGTPRRRADVSAVREDQNNVYDAGTPRRRRNLDGGSESGVALGVVGGGGIEQQVELGGDGDMA